uniref:Uncharacterized protein n=1 Tax=Setaria digitata TaxID=48799 RepID=A0A915Q299_9BILA
MQLELHERLAELEAKKLTITNEINAAGTPDEQRERLLQTVVRTTDEINVVQKQLDDVKVQIEQAVEELNEFDTELENAAGEKNEKYRELKLKEMEIDEFLSSYDNLRAEEELKIDKISSEVIRLLELISINYTYCQLISDKDEHIFNAGGAVSTSALNELYVCVQDELLAMEGTEKHLNRENVQIDERINEVVEMMEQFEDIDNLKLQTEQKHQELENRREILNEELPKINSSCQKLMNELEQTKSILEKNDDYKKLKDIQKQWQIAEQKLEELREVAAKRDAETNYEVLKKENKNLEYSMISQKMQFIARVVGDCRLEIRKNVTQALHLQAEYNAVLIESMKPC